MARSSSVTGSAASARLVLDRGKPIPIARTNRITIGPCDAAADRIVSSQETKKVLFNAIKPAQLQLRVKRINLAAGNSITVEGDAVESLASCADLKRAGLEVKTKAKLDPRIVIHDVSVGLAAEGLVEAIIEQNLSGCASDSVKVVYMYPARDKKFRSCIVQLSAENRARLFQRSRVAIDWYSCRFADHVTILQCFKCQKFGHIMASCKSDACCEHCAGNHLSKECPAKDSLCCANCSAARMANTAHAASDRAKCRVLRQRIERKIASIDYSPSA